MIYHRPNKFTEWLNRAFSWLASFGLTPSDTVAIEVAGRRSGKVRANPVTTVEQSGQLYLVSVRGESEWVRNVRAARGEAVLRHRFRRRPVRLEELPPEQSAPVLQPYLKKTAMATKRYFGIEPDAPLDEFARIAARHPVFLVRDSR